ncbi:MAG: flagellar basal body rod protein FlgB [Alphaproteobacteria bacterium]|nr:MAG: flagellar basal body rod protein FlgB [Alphaproteobacteria bacterium]
MANLSDAITGRMNFLTQRQGVVAGNIANANTPGYISRDMVSTSKNADTNAFGMAVTTAQHMAGDPNKARQAGTMTEDTRFIQHNGNSVRLDEEMLKMTDIQLNYRMMTEVYAKHVAMQKMALGQR